MLSKSKKQDIMLLKQWRKQETKRNLTTTQKRYLQLDDLESKYGIRKIRMNTDKA